MSNTPHTGSTALLMRIAELEREFADLRPTVCCQEWDVCNRPCTAHGRHNAETEIAVLEARCKAAEQLLYTGTVAPSGEVICACRNRNAVKAGMETRCWYCDARAVIAQAQAGGDK